MHNGFNVALIFAVAIGVGWTGVLAMETNAEGFAEYHDRAEGWCDSRGGELYNAMSVWHGGLHCELENGTHVHMADVVDTGTE